MDAPPPPLFPLFPLTITRQINWLHVEKRLDFFRGELADIRETIASNLLSPEHAEAFQASIPAMVLR